MNNELSNPQDILDQVNSVLPTSNNKQYQKAIKLLSDSQEILQFVDDEELSQVVDKLHESIDLYLEQLPMCIELEMLFESGQVQDLAA